MLFIATDYVTCFWKLRPLDMTQNTEIKFFIDK